ncbi:MAG: helix-turn-helix domain-containing protein [Candidatus Neomarinimicrobiota bacterium]
MQLTSELAEIIIKKMMVAAGVKMQKELATILGVQPPSISTQIKKGQIPDRWFGVIEKNYNVTRIELLKDLPQERAVTVADLSYREAHLQQNSPPAAAVSDQVENYSPEAWKQLCLTHFGDLFDYIAEVYGNDPRAIERFKRDLRSALPDYRLWLYGEEEKKSLADGSSDIPKAAGNG